MTINKPVVLFLSGILLTVETSASNTEAESFSDGMPILDRRAPVNNPTGEGTQGYDNPSFDIIDYSPIGPKVSQGEVMQSFWQLSDSNHGAPGVEYEMHPGLDLTTYNFMVNPSGNDLDLYMPEGGQIQKWKHFSDPNHPENQILIRIPEGSGYRGIIYGHVYVNNEDENEIHHEITTWTDKNKGDLIGRAAEPTNVSYNFVGWGACHVHVEVHENASSWTSDLYNPLDCDGAYGSQVIGFDGDQPKAFHWPNEYWPLETYGSGDGKGWKMHIDDQIKWTFRNNFPYSATLQKKSGEELHTWICHAFEFNNYTEEYKYNNNWAGLKIYTADSHPNIDDLGFRLEKAYKLGDEHNTFPFVADNNEPQSGYAVGVYDVARNFFWDTIVEGGGEQPAHEPPQPQPPYQLGFPYIPYDPYFGDWNEVFPVISAAAVADVDGYNPNPNPKEIIYCQRGEPGTGGEYIRILESNGDCRKTRSLPECFMIMGSPVPVDLDPGEDYGELEIIIAANGSIKGRVYALDKEALWYIWEGCHYYLLDAKTDATPSVGDIDNDGYPDIAIGDDVGNVHVINRNGNLMWKRNLGAPVKRPVAIGDIDFDGELEIAAIGYNLGSKQTILKVWDSDGSELHGDWTVTLNHPYAEDIAKNNEIMLVDIDRNGDLEIIFACGPAYGGTGEPKIRIYNQYKNQLGISPIIADSNGSILIGDYIGGDGGVLELIVANNTQDKKMPIYDLSTGQKKKDQPLKYYNIDNYATVGDVDMDDSYFEVFYPGWKNGEERHTKNNLWGTNIHELDKPPPFPSLPQYGEDEWICPLGIWKWDYYIPGNPPIWVGHWYHYGAEAPPKVADIDNDGDNEIIIADRRADMHVYDSVGTLGRSWLETEWGEFQHDPMNTGNYELFPPIGITVRDTANDQGHSLTVEWLASIDDIYSGNRSRRAYRYQVYRANATESPLTFVNAGYLVAGEPGAGGYYTFVDDNPSIQPTVPYCYYVVSKTVAYGSPPFRRASTPSLSASAIAHDNTPPEPPTNFAGDVIDDGSGSVYVHLTWDLSFDDPYHSGGEPGDGSRAVANVYARAPEATASGIRPAGGVASLQAGNDSPIVESFRAPVGPGLTSFPLSEKEGEALKVKAAERRVQPRIPRTTGPRPASDVEPADGGLDAGANDVQYYDIWREVDGNAPCLPHAVLEAGTSEFDDLDVEYGHFYDYTIFAKDGENSSEGCGPIYIDMNSHPGFDGDGGSLASAPGGPSALEPYYDPSGGSLAAPFAVTGRGAGRTKAARVITCKPNPVTGTATFTITLPTACPVKLDVYDLSGRRVDTVLDKTARAGGEAVLWQPRVPTGVYIYRLETPGRQYSGKVVVAR